MNPKLNTQDKSNFISWLEISRYAYSKNINFFKKLVEPRTKISVVIKANAYGHGMIEIAALAKENGIDTFCVHSLDEALELRENGFNEKIIVIGPVLRNRIYEAVKNNLTLSVYNFEHLEIIDEAAKYADKKALVHVKVETGTNRQGVLKEDAANFFRLLSSLKNVELEAVYSHFANIEDTTNHSYAMKQLEIFDEIVSIAKENGASNFQRHFASSAAAILFKKTHFDMIRLGISQYGLWPSRETYLSFTMNNPDLSENILYPVLTWKTRIAQIKWIKSGEYIGYGCSYQTSRDSKIAIIPIGYSDGLDRKMSNHGFVLVKGKRAPIRGRIAMNLTVIDITDIENVALEDEVTILGTDGNQSIKAETIAELSGTINYEAVTKISRHLPRIIV